MADNAGLLQRWLDKMNLTAEEMNVEFEKESADKGENQTAVESDQKGTSGTKKEKGKDKEDFRKGGKV